MTNLMLAVWKGSEKTALAVRNEIAKRWGTEEAEKYDPLKNCFTLKTWGAKGYRVRKGEKAIRSTTLLEVKDRDSKDGTKEIVSKSPNNVYLFYDKQVEKRQAA